VLFAREGAKVLAADINRDAALETKRIIDAEGGIREAVSADVSRAADVSAMVSACIAAFGRIDVLHNNVGIVEVGGPVETTEESGTTADRPTAMRSRCDLRVYHHFSAMFSARRSSSCQR
jgi:NAD(P)-dependent dehydrogenase (short-subunit alcohol dehydrogenase family)